MIKQRIIEKGLTFLELIIVMAIFSALGATLLFNFSDFSSNISLQNISQEVALQLRGAQSSSVNGRIPELSLGQLPNEIDWTPSYGIYFETPGGIASDRFWYFFDRESNESEDDVYRGFFNDATDDVSCGFNLSECVDEVEITTGDVVAKLCVNEISSGQLCGAGQEVEDLHISFRRPSPSGIIKSDTFNGVISDATIYIMSPKEQYRRIVVSITGQISVQQYELP